VRDIFMCFERLCSCCHIRRYDALKKYIYQLEKQQHDALTQRHDLEANESTSLVSSSSPDTDAVFRPLLDDELHKISLFYSLQYKKLLEEEEQVEELVREQDGLGLVASRLYAVEDDEDEDDDDEGYTRDPSTERQTTRRRRRPSLSIGPLFGPSSISKESPTEARRMSLSAEDNEDLEMSLASLRQSQILSAPQEEEPLVEASGPSNRSRYNSDATSPTRARNVVHKLTASLVSIGHSPAPPPAPLGESIWTATTNYALDTQLLFKRRLTNLFTDVSSLKSYVEMNYSGFRKILKKCVC
jgi:phosphate transporter